MPRLKRFSYTRPTLAVRHYSGRGRAKKVLINIPKTLSSVPSLGGAKAGFAHATSSPAEVIMPETSCSVDNAEEAERPQLSR